jgi:hypothetical protein
MQLFTILTARRRNVPVVLVITRVDRYMLLAEAECRRAYKKQNGLKKRALKSSDLDIIQQLGEERVREYKVETCTRTRSLYPQIRGPLFTDKGITCEISSLNILD